MDRRDPREIHFRRLQGLRTAKRFFSLKNSLLVVILSPFHYLTLHDICLIHSDAASVDELRFLADLKSQDCFPVANPLKPFKAF